MKFYSVYQTLCSVGFILLIAHTRAYQEAHWPEGRVVYVHPWVLVIAYILGILALIFGTAGTRDPELGPRLDRLMPMAAWMLLLCGVVLMAIFFPGPYAP
ncbi:hypothetical protein H4P12_05040 [Paracoccus sp. 11-3]|uniref:Uncharacterized protein n=1 Tax=Paracoccus amoyensis TaxID=2760093 RepID=A0A926G5E8_9RHOB|nr:hypothetical protein [Paracoccus amoyensis]MBC9246088.1 hypothetical protein [Paracoccus amoyensis]